MDLSFESQQDELRQRARSFFRSHVTRDVRRELAEEGSEFVRSFHRQLGKEGWIGLQWPSDFGGAGAGHVDGAILQEEAALAGAPMLASNISAIVGSTVIQHADDQVIRQFLPGLVSGETVMCLGYSEPEAGSDLASLSTRAERQGDSWVITGGKMFTSLAHVADTMFCLTRTSDEGAPHHGLTMFLVPMDKVRVAPVWTLGGFRTNATYLDGIEVSDADRVGAPGRGWKVVMTALDFERAGTARVGQAKRLIGLVCRELQARGAAAADWSVVAHLWARTVALEALAYEVSWLQERGESSTRESSMAKVAGTELVQEITRAALDLLGASALLARGAPGAIAEGELEVEYRNAMRYTVTAGTNEIQRNIIAQRGLGLPRGA
jgi:hypothetical protein